MEHVQTFDWARLIELAARASAGTLPLDQAYGELRILANAAPEVGHDTFEVIEYDATATPTPLKGEFPTGIAALDSYLEGGGRRGELAYVSAPPKDGKTTFLITLGAHLVRHLAIKVLHISAEIYAPEIHQRYTECFMRRPLAQCLEENLRQLGQEIKGSLHLVDIVSRPTIDTVETLVKKVQPDVLIVDYGDLIHVHCDNRFTEVGLVWENLRRIGRVYNCFVWTAGRLNRDGKESESYLKTYNCDLHVRLLVDSANTALGLANLQVEEIRRGKGRYETIRLAYQPQCCYVGGGI